MADQNQNEGTWPLPKFYFQVDFGDSLNDVAFQEVSGLDAETQPIEYRHSNTPIFAPIKMPGLGKIGNVTMKRGVMTNNNDFMTWYNEVKMNTIKRQTVVIKLLDDQGNVAMTWTLQNAWPTKITGTDLKSEGEEIAIDTLELAYESMTIKTG